jgi:hypothetical protein
MILAGVLGLVALELQALEHAPSRWTFDAGYSHRFFKAADNEIREQRLYQNRARDGWAFGGDVSVYPLESFGVGVTFSQFHHTLRDDDIAFPDETRGRMRDVYSMRYAGPAAFYRRRLPLDLELVAQAGAGWLFYHNQHEAKDYPGVLEGLALGLHGGLSLDYRPFRRIGVGLTARFIHGKLDGVDYNAMRIPLPELSLTRADVGVGVRFYP